MQGDRWRTMPYMPSRLCAAAPRAHRGMSISVSGCNRGSSQLIFGGVGRCRGAGLGGRGHSRIPGCGLGRGLGCRSRRRGIYRRWPGNVVLFPGPRDFTRSCLSMLISVGCTYFRGQYSSYGSTCRDPRALRAPSQWSCVRPRQQHA